MRRFYCVIIYILFTSLCHGQPTIAVSTIQGNKYSIKASKTAQFHVFFFLAPECPLSQSYSVTIKHIVDAYRHNKAIDFMLVFPGKHIEKQEINGFLNKYKLSGISSLVDPQLQLSHRLKATSTPQVVILNNTLKPEYSGQIDNWAMSLGQKRQVITAHYLEDALNALVNNKPVKVQKTSPVGCFIE